MASFVTPQNGDDALAEHVAQLTENLSGLRNIPISLTGINDAAAYAQTIKNAGVGSKDCIMYAADGTTVLLQVDGTGVKASRAGGPAAPIVTTGDTGTITTAMLADRSVTNVKLGTDTARLNLLTNGGFEIWQRGNGPFTTNGLPSADRWALLLAGTDTLSVAADSANTDGSVYCMAATFVLGSGAGQTIINQTYPDDLARQMRGRTMTFSVRVRTATPNAVNLAYYDGTAWTYTATTSHPGDGTYRTLTTTFTVVAGATIIGVAVSLKASCTAYLDNAMLVVGSVAADYAPLHPADDLARCLRYYERLDGDAGGNLIISGVAGGAGVARVGFPYKAIKPITPTVTWVGTWANVNSTGGSIDIIGAKACRGATSVSAAGPFHVVNSGAGSNIVVEAN
jgi:hypothetical protein